MLAFGPYVVEAELGRGAAGVVYRARGPQGEVVALKVLVPRHGDERQARRVAREVRVLERLRHPAIVAVRAAGEVRGGLWIAMDLVDGQTLQRRLDTGGPLAPREAAALVLELARALAHAHAEGVLHRDLKPDNVLLDRAGRPFLTDFGLAKDLEGSLHGASLSVTGQFMGTPGYWPPEQARGERGAIGPTSDVYALGATLFAALTGGPPYAAESLIEALAAAERAPPAPSSRNPDVPPALDAVVARCLRPALEDRYASTDDLARALEGFLAGARARRRPRRRWPLALVGGAGAAALLVAAVALRREAPEPGRVDPAPTTTTTTAEPVAAEGVSPGQAAMLEVLREARRRGVDVEDTAAFLTVFDAMPPEVLATDDVAGWRATTHVLRALERRVANDPAWRDDAVAAVGLARGRPTSAARLALARALSNLEQHDEALATFEGLLDDPGEEDRAGLVRAVLTACREALPGLRGSFLRRGASNAHGPRVIALLERAAALDDPAVEADRADVLVTLALATALSDDEGRARAALDRAGDGAAARLAKVEWHLARGELDAAAARLVSAGSAAPRPRLSLLEGVLELEQLAARGHDDAASARAHAALAQATAQDPWTRSVRDHLIARRATTLGLPAPGEDRERTRGELDLLERLNASADDMTAYERYVALLGDLPPRALTQPQVQELRATVHLRAGDVARAQGDHATARRSASLGLAELRPPLRTRGHALRGDALFDLERWDEALDAFVAVLAERPEWAVRARGRILEAASRSRHPTLDASLLRPPTRPPDTEQARALVRSLLPEGEPPTALNRMAAVACLARAAHDAGDAAGLDECLRTLEELGRAGWDLPGLEAERHLAAGRLDEARAGVALARSRVAEADAVLLERLDRLSRLIEVQAAAAAGQVEQARGLAASLLAELRAAPERRWNADARAHVEEVLAGLGGRPR